MSYFFSFLPFLELGGKFLTEPPAPGKIFRFHALLQLLPEILHRVLQDLRRLLHAGRTGALGQGDGAAEHEL